MFLKRVTLQGFKSFADRTEFEFGPGVTAIVGPNGCGKSNVVDAVRWVLGEQSAKSLRGTRMLDVVFAGSGARPAANFAEVILTFDNADRRLDSDQDEVTVQRTLYRSGESEYRLNGNTCRLKDIRGLLMDTGIGASAYAIIEQGRVDVLLQASPVERREIFEEAAGISRYRVQRAEAARKLERTQNNLLRLNDVLDELERRLRSVKLAAGKARNFQEYDQRLRELRSEFALAEYHQLEQTRAETAAAVTALDEQLQALRQRLAAGDAEAAQVERELREAEGATRESEAALAELQRERSTLEERQAQGARRVEELTELRSRRAGQAEEVEGRVATLVERVQREEGTLAELAGEVERHEQRVAQLREQAAAAEETCAGTRTELEEARSAAFEAARQQTALSNQQTYLREQHERVEQELARLGEREQTLRQEEAGLDERRTTLSGEAASLDGRARELSERVRGLDQTVEQLAEALREAGAQIAAQKETRAGIVSRVNMLSDMERRLEGVDRGTRAVLAWREREGATAGVLGLVADVLRIDDPRVGALQPVLSTFENHVVVATAEACLAELAQAETPEGPVRLVALDRLRPRRGGPVYVGAAGYVGRAADWVQCEGRYRGLAEWFLGRVFVFERIDDVLPLTAPAGPDDAFVTLDGHVLSGGQLTVGAGQATAGLISRKAEIRQLQQQLDEVETALERATRAQQAREAEQADAQVQRSGLMDELAGVQRQYAERQTALMRLDDEAGRVRRELEVTAGELSERRARREQIDGQVAELDAQHAQADAAQREVSERIEALRGTLLEQQRAAEALDEAQTAGLVELGRCRERWSASEAALTDLRQRVEGLHAERAAAEREAQEASAAIATAEGELATARARAEELGGLIRAREQSVQTQLACQQSLRERLEQCGATSRALHEEIEGLDGQRHERQVGLREADVRQENLVARIAEELGLDLAARYAEYTHTEQDWAAIREEIDALRTKIARLGNVNLDAITELEELTPRYENLCEQKRDLEGSIAHLEQLIMELDEESRRRFLETYEQVRVNFQELFRKLFGGGKADIVLEDPDAPLTCGIEVIARPPGKEPQSISLLSGGEKTLAAVALLLGVFQSRPSPFAILDEVDAALDEANVGRFNTVVHEFLDKSQFVVITHNKRTMQSADVLYGVTMQERGVSQRVSVRFDDRVDTPNVA